MAKKDTTPKITDLASRLGLRAAYTKRKEDWNAAPFVKAMYEQDLPDIAKRFHTTPMDQISSSTQIRDAALDLAEKYGQAIWPESPHRPWLFNPGQPATSAPYTNHLYFSKPLDRQFIEQTIYELVVARTKRYRKDKIKEADPPRSGSVVSDATWTPAMTTRHSRPSMFRNSTSSMQSGLTCWAYDKNDTTHAHWDAAGLKEAGVWLGSYNDEKEVVHGLCFDDVTRNYFVDTQGGTKRGTREPPVFDEVPGSETRRVRCAACNETGPPLEIRCITFDWDEKETETLMWKNMWIFKCSLDGKEVFAIVRDEGQRGPDNGAQHLYSFWRVNGGYTASIYLSDSLFEEVRTAVNDESSRPSGLKRKREVSCRSIADSQSGSAESDIPARTIGQRFNAINRQAALPFQELPYDRPNGQVSIPSRRRSQSRVSEHNSLYSTTPPLQRNVPDLPVDHNHTDEAGTTTSQALVSRKSTSGSLMSAPVFTLRFRLWITADWSDARKVVFLTDAMDVADVFDLIENRLASKLEGKSVAELRVWLGDKQTGAQYLDLDVQDRDGWETVLEYAKENGGPELSGAVSRQD